MKPTSENNASTLKYSGIFAASYAALILLIYFVNYILNLDLGSGVNAALLVGSVYSAIAAFVHDYGRAPNKSERRMLTFWGIVSSYVISFIVAWVVLGFSGHDYSELFEKLTQSAAIFLGSIALIIMTLFYYVVLTLCFLAFGKIAVKQHEKAYKGN